MPLYRAQSPSGTPIMPAITCIASGAENSAGQVDFATFERQVPEAGAKVPECDPSRPAIMRGVKACETSARNLVWPGGS